MTTATTSVPRSGMHDPPRLLAVARVQLRTVGEATRWELLALGLTMVGTAAFLGFYYVWKQSQIDFDLVAMAVPAAIVGLLAPIAIWKREEPSRRAYLWTMPIDRSRHTLVKVACGWAWLMAVVTVYLLWALAISLVTGGDIGIDVIRRPMLEGLPAGTRILDFSLHGRPWMWLVPFAGATVAYLSASALVLATDRPWLWGAGIFFAWVLPASIADETKVAWLSAFTAVVFGRYGVVTVFTALTFIPDPSGAPDVDLGITTGIAWGVATLLWLGLMLAGTVLAAYRHQER